MYSYVHILGWPETHYVVEDKLEFLILPVPPESWDDLHVPSCLTSSFGDALIEHRALCMLEKTS